MKVILIGLLVLLPPTLGLLGGLLNPLELVGMGTDILNQVTGGMAGDLLGSAFKSLKKAIFSNCGDIAKSVREENGEPYAMELMVNSFYTDDGYFKVKWTTVDTEAMIKQCIGEVTMYSGGVMPCCSAGAGWSSETIYPDRGIRAFEVKPMCDERSTLVIRYKYKTNEKTYGDANGEIRLEVDMKGTTTHCPLEDSSAKTQSMQVPFLMIAGAAFFVLIGLILCGMRMRRGCLFRCFNPCFDGTCLDIGDSEEEWDDEEEEDEEDLEMGDVGFVKSNRDERNDYEDDFQRRYERNEDDYTNEYEKSY